MSSRLVALPDVVPVSVNVQFAVSVTNLVEPDELLASSVSALPEALMV
jgi:hypothetical protein